MTMMNSKLTSGMIKSLQTLRFVFALMIFHHHFFTNPQIVPFGTFPVAFFFILSGYVMAIGYEEKVCSQSFSYKNYMKKRLLRIVPLNLLCLMMAIFSPVLGDIVHWDFHLKAYAFYFLDVLMLQSWIPVKSIYFSGNAVAWFLSSMMFCYLLFPFLLKRIKAKGRVLLMLTMLIVYFILIQFIQDDYVHALIYISPLFRVVDFTIGISLYYRIKRISVEKRCVLLGTSLEIFAIGISIIALIIYSSIPKQYGLVSLYWIPSILLVMAFTLSEKMGGVISRMFKHPVLVYFGTLSFPFYMMHAVIIGWYHRLAHHIDLLSTSIMGAILCLSVTTILAYLYTTRIEPFIKKKLSC